MFSVWHQQHTKNHDTHKKTRKFRNERLTMLFLALSRWNMFLFYMPIFLLSIKQLMGKLTIRILWNKSIDCQILIFCRYYRCHWTKIYDVTPFISVCFINITSEKASLDNNDCFWLSLQNSSLSCQAPVNGKWEFDFNNFKCALKLIYVGITKCNNLNHSISIIDNVVFFTSLPFRIFIIKL